LQIEILPEKQQKADQIAEMLGVTRRQLHNYVEQWGCPKHGTGRDAFYLWSEVRKWWIDYLLKINAPPAPTAEKLDLVEAQARKADIDAKRGEIKLARERREVVSIADVVAVVSQANSNVRTRILQIPDKLTPKIVSLGADKKRIKAVLKAEVLEALDELANPAEVAQA
jgi:phage terminase Nu1 subunit (DNA packaging protein)